RNKSVVPPIPREVRSAKEVPDFNSTPHSGSAATIFASSTRMICRMLLRPSDHQFVARAADLSRANLHDGVARPGFVQQELDPRLHGAKVVNVFVPGVANGSGQSFAGDAGNRGLARGVDIQQHQY